MFTKEELHYIKNCTRWVNEGTSNFWVKLIAKMWEEIKTLEAEIESARDKDTEAALNNKKGT